ncbi:DUF2290 domain-containing protein [Photobacterium phosphoreum]|uniref:DUF2290 domain-containing protein n=1 Tax=Photobacterium phosphoreum TaxID=659 RepID=UPI0015E79EA8|nr:DUF2290 domain-containing protein [Photobacterium phosphoreum]
MTPKQTITAISNITAKLITAGICDDQNFVAEVKTHNETHINYSGFSDVSIALKNVEYSDIYNYLSAGRQFNYKLIDGGLIQLLYCFNEKQELIKHRLCYFPSPDFEAFQNDPEIYLDESIYYSDIVLKSILPVPVRFDYDPANFEELKHPASHLSLGQYKNCRIPIVAPICPANFINFILRSFYCTAKLELPLDFPYILMEETIVEKEKNGIHLSVI